MSPSLKTLTVLGLAAATASAFESISVPSTVTAGKATTLTIENDIGSSGSFDSQFAYFRVFLTISPPGWGYNPVCYLANQTAIDVTSLKVTIPASVGPDASNYTLSVFEYNTDPNAESSSSGFMYTDEFELVGGTGAYSNYEIDPSGPWSLGPEDDIPCEAYACVRECADKYYPDNLPNGDDLAAIKNTYLCSAECPGTSYPEWLSEWDDVDGDGESDIPESSTTGAAATGTGVSKATGTATTGPAVASTSSAVVSETDAPGAGSVAGVSGGVLAAGLVAGLVMGM
jgi:hypothetical protein